LVSAFFHIDDKLNAWGDLIKLTTDTDWFARRGVIASADLSSIFSKLPIENKQKAWNELVKLIIDNDDFTVKSKATNTLSSTFSQLPDRQQAWDKLFKLIDNPSDSEADPDVRFRASKILVLIFPYVPSEHRQQAWNGLIKLTTDNAYEIRSEISPSLGSAFYHVPDKQKALEDLIRLTTNEDSDVRSWATFTLGFAFYQIPKKEQAWDELSTLANDISSEVRSRAAYAIGSAFPYIPNKEQARSKLCELIGDDNDDVVIQASYSHGRVCVFNASQAEKDEDYKEELKNAITFFEKEYLKSKNSNSPSAFWLPFYRVFYEIIYEQSEVKSSNKYFTEAKNAVRGSKRKKLLLDFAENFIESSEEVKEIEKLSLKVKKGNLDFYSKYFGNAATILRNAKDIAPFDAETLKRGLLILNKDFGMIL